MRILHISSPLTWRGGEQQLAYLIDELRERGIDQEVLCADGSAVESFCRNNKVTCYTFNKNILQIVSASIINEICVNDNISLIHTHDAHSHSAAVLSSMIFGNSTPIIVSRRTNFPICTNWFSKVKYNHSSVSRIVCVSEKIKEHSSILIKDMSHMLDMVSPDSFKNAIEKLKPLVKEEEKNIPGSVLEANNNSIKVDLSKRKPDPYVFEKSENEIIKEKIIMDEENDSEDIFFQNYESEILKPIKSIDSLLKQIASFDVAEDEIFRWADLMKTNGDLSAKIGFEIIANMHRILSRAFSLLDTGELVPKADVIESMRACLIVIVAVVKGKEVDITNYLNSAEEFGRKIQIFN